MKNIFFYCLLVTTSFVFGQKLNFKIENDLLNKKMVISDLSDKVLKSIFEKENNFTVNYLGLDEGYYLLKKDNHEILLYLKPSDDLTITFDNENVYNSLTFSGKGSDVNNYLLSRSFDRVDKKGKLNAFYKKSFYEGDEETYLKKLDNYYKEQYGVLFSRRFDKNFSDEEMKDLQYAYSLDLLKYQDAKKYYKLKDSLQPSSSFLQPLNQIHFENNEFYKKHNSYRELAILKWRNNILEIKEAPLRDEIYNSIRIAPLKQKVLEKLVVKMNRDHPGVTKSIYNLIKKNATNNRLILDAKERYALIKYKDSEKNLSKFKYKDSDGLERTLAEYKGKYIFVYFWMTYCKPCVKNFEKIEALKEKFSEERIEFVAIAIEKEENFLRWKGILEENKIKEPQLFFEGEKLKLIKEYNLTSVPDFKIFSTLGVPIDDIDVKKLDKKTEKIISEILE